MFFEPISKRRVFIFASKLSELLKVNPNLDY